MSLSPLLFNIILEILGNIIRQKKETKWIYIGKEDIKVLFTDNMIVYFRISESICKKLELMSDYSRVAGYKVNIQSQLLSYIPTINKYNLKLKTQYIYISTPQNEIFRYKFDKIYTRPV